MMSNTQREPEPMDSRTDRSLLQTEQAYLKIKEMILLGEISPLAMLDEKKLMAELGFGRTPIREALQRLAHAELVTIIPYRGMFVAGIDMADLDEIMEMRVPLEVLASRLAAERITDEDVKNLRKLIAQYDVEELCKKTDIPNLLKLDHEFHRAVTTITNNRFIEKTLDNLRDFTWRFHILFYRRRRPNPRDHFNNYISIIDALESRDPDQVEKCILDHFGEEQNGN
jgi:DNA-binding GntR family transcriptional regulator